MFLGPEASQESLKRPKKAPKRHPKHQQKIGQEEQCPVEIALARRSRFGSVLDPILKPTIRTFFNHFSTFFWSLFGKLLEPILGPILVPDRQKRGQDEPKRTIKSFKESKNCIFKKVVFAWDIHHFFALRASQKSVKGPKKAPKRHPKNSKTPKKKTQNWTQKLSKLGQILEQFWGPKRQAKNSQKKTFLGPPSPASQGSK